MSGPQEIPLEYYLDAEDILLVVRPGTSNRPEIFLALQADGTARAFSGHVDLGTGIRTALAQIVAEELDLPIERVSMVLGTTSAAPDQGPTIASETIQVTAIPLRHAAATARAFLLGKAATLRTADAATLSVTDGIVSGDGWSITYAELIAGRHERIEIDPHIPVKSPDHYRIVGRSQRRNDIAGKARRVTGPMFTMSGCPACCTAASSARRMPASTMASLSAKALIADRRDARWLRSPVSSLSMTDGDFVGVVATREENAVEAMKRLKVTLARAADPRPDLNRVEEALRGNPTGKDPAAKGKRRCRDRAGRRARLSCSAPMSGLIRCMARSAPPAPSPTGRTASSIVWSGTQNPHWMRRDLALLMSISRKRRSWSSGSKRRAAMAATAPTMSRPMRHSCPAPWAGPVRVQLTREQEHGWEPKGAGQVIDVRGGIDLEGGPAAYDFETRYPVQPGADAGPDPDGQGPRATRPMEMGDRTAIPPYAIGNMRIQVHDMPPIARASWFRGVSAMPNSFAHESFIDELAAAAHVDPIEYRLRYLTDSARHRPRPRRGRERAANGRRAPAGAPKAAKATCSMAAASPMRCMSTANSPAYRPPGRPGSPMSPSTGRPASLP